MANWRETNLFKFVKGLAIGVAGAAAASCSSLPDDPGLYAVDQSGEIRRLTGGPKWDRETWEDRSDLPSKLRFFIVAPGIATNADALSEKVELRLAGWVRSDITADGAISPAQAPQWVAADIDSFSVPLTYSHLGQRQDIIAASPLSGALEQGLYVLELSDGAVNLSGRFGVNWTKVDKTAYASKRCIDRYQAGNPNYRVCADQQNALAAYGLQVLLVEPEKRTVAGRPVIVVKGVVLNKSDRRRSVPTLEGRLVDSSGQALHDWRFNPSAEQVEAGGSVSFESVVEDAPPNASNVEVRFTDTTVAGR